MPQQHVKVSGRCNRRRAPTVGIDTLPDEFLWRMPSFLPVREAAQTCVLGPRWRHLWRYMPVMRIVSGDGPLTRKGVKDMNRFVNIFMFLRDRGAPLELCELKIENLMYVKMNHISAYGSNRLCCLKLVLLQWKDPLKTWVLVLMTCLSYPGI
ncbi:hypothetical protein PAHAL_8G060500 [Panicum hallii]|uniref:F-box domain-containing protein n=1 Tax=Panicum hallii TaxID=206008 RepID=A0A2T8I7W0_9POAL|nr:hypothetical protein PAHAL_8G060500 [Panicum hallii]PVH33761.1 hypothetical protein PAHAL_8G060500 [Panicum hallii]